MLRCSLIWWSKNNRIRKVNSRKGFWCQDYSQSHSSPISHISALPKLQEFAGRVSKQMYLFWSVKPCSLYCDAHANLKQTDICGRIKCQKRGRLFWVFSKRNPLYQPTMYQRRCKTTLFGQSAGLSIPRSLVRIRPKLKKKLRTQIYIDLSYIDPQGRVLNYCCKYWKQSSINMCVFHYCPQTDAVFMRSPGAPLPNISYAYTLLLDSFLVQWDCISYTLIQCVQWAAWFWCAGFCGVEPREMPNNNAKLFCLANIANTPKLALAICDSPY